MTAAAARAALEELADLVWPLACPSCGTAGRWCLTCRPDVAATGRVVLLPDGTPVAAADVYAGATAASLRAWKLGGRRGLTAPLADHLAEAVAHLLAPAAPVVLVPVPVRRASRRRRGGDLVADLARAAAAQQPGARLVRCLRWRRTVAEQVGAGPDRRRANLAGSMAVSATPPLAVVVVDDILTTGATLGEAVRALREAGAVAVAGAVVAAAADRHADERRPVSAG